MWLFNKWTIYTKSHIETVSGSCVLSLYLRSHECASILTFRLVLSVSVLPACLNSEGARSLELRVLGTEFGSSGRATNGSC